MSTADFRARRKAQKRAYDSIVHRCARRFARAGLGFVPSRPDGKHPAIAWKPYQTKATTEGEVEQWWSEDGKHVGSGITVMTGRRNGFVVVDPDTPAAVEWCEKHLPHTPAVKLTKRGRHLYYRYDEQLVDALAMDGKLETRDGKGWLKQAIGGHVPGQRGVVALDIKADGALTVALGSWHASGTCRYRMVESEREAASDGGPSRPPQVGAEKSFDPHDPNEFLRRLAEAPAFDPAWFDTLCFCGSATCRREPGNGWKHRSHKYDTPPAVSMAARLNAPRKAARYIDSIPGAPEGVRERTAFRVAAHLTRGYDLDDATAWPLLVEWNDRNMPPLGESELRAKLRAGRINGKYPLGYLFGEYTPPKSTAAGGPPAADGKVSSTPHARSSQERRRRWYLSTEDRVWLYQLVTSLENRGEYGKAKRLRRLYRCGVAEASLVCCRDANHPPDGTFRMMCESAGLCTYCARQRARTIAASITGDNGGLPESRWVGEQAVDARLAVLEVHVEAVDPGAAFADARTCIKRACGEAHPYRWITGLRTCLWVGPIQSFVALKSARRAIRKAGLNAKLHKMPLGDVAQRVADVWREPSLELIRMVRKRATAEIEAFAFLDRDLDRPRTRGNRAGEKLLPWPSEAAIREWLKAERAEREGDRGGVPRDRCAHVMCTDDHGNTVRCGARTRLVAWVHGTGEALHEADPSQPSWKAADQALAGIEAYLDAKVYEQACHSP